MQSVPDCLSAFVAVPMVAHPVLDRFDTYTGDIPVRTHHHRLPVECIGTGGLTAPVALERLKYLEFVPDILVALLLHRNWMAVHLWVRLPYLCYLTRNTDTEAGVSLPLHSKSFAGWIVIPFQILAGSYLLPENDISYL